MSKSFGVPFDTREGDIRGAPAGEPIDAHCIRADYRLLAVVEHDKSRRHIRALNPHAFEVYDGYIVGDVDTEGTLRVVFTTGKLQSERHP